MLTSIDTGPIRGDLGQRSMVIELMPFRDGVRGEQELNHRFDAARGRIQGALYDLTCKVLRRKGEVKLDNPGRLVDFERILATVDLIDGTDGLERYQGTGARVAIEVVESSAVAMGIVRLLLQQESWEGTFDELRRAVEPDQPPKNWPRTGKGMGSEVRRVADELGAAGILVALPTDATRGKTRGRARLLTLRVVDRELLKSQLGGGGEGAAPLPKASCKRPSKASRPSNGPWGGLPGQADDGAGAVEGGGVQ